MIYYHRYTLKGKKMEREGALLQIDGGVADCHPWPELGDQPLNTQLQKLANGETTRLTERSLYFASLDRKAREENRSLFQNLTIPPSHYLMLDLSEDVSEPLVKIKLGNEPENLMRFLQRTSCRVRLDFNARLKKDEFLHFLELIKPHHHRIDCIEDPFPFDDAAWGEIQEKYRVPLACDAHSERAIGHSPQYLVLKPAVQSHLPFTTLTQKRIVTSYLDQPTVQSNLPFTHLTQKRIVTSYLDQPTVQSNLPFTHLTQQLIVTSYLDHPIGQLSAAYIAAQLKVTHCGLCSHLVYQTNEFSEQLGRQLIPPAGTGFGYDTLLKKLPWKRL